MEEGIKADDLEKLKRKNNMEPKQLIELIGNTPLVISRNLIQNPNVQLLLKLEGNNPGGSVKDRAAYNMIASAIERGEIKKGDKLISHLVYKNGVKIKDELKQKSYSYKKL